MTRLSMCRGGQRNLTQSYINFSNKGSLYLLSAKFNSLCEYCSSGILILPFSQHHGTGSSNQRKSSTLLASLSVFILAISKYLLSGLLVQMLWRFVPISCLFLFSSVLCQCVGCYLFHLFRSLTLSNASSLFLVLNSYS